VNSRAQAILDFWFGPPTSPDYGKPREAWFEKDPEFDEAIRHHFLADYEAAAAGECDRWQDTPAECLALVILLDQFPRNMFRDDPRAFATDGKALDVARHAVAAGFDRQVGETGRTFFYLPFEHSEDMSCQDRSLELFRAQPDWDQPGSPFQYAQRHWEIIRRFGRFPHRNRILGRASTPPEVEFLTLPDSGF